MMSTSAAFASRRGSTRYIGYVVYKATRSEDNGLARAWARVVLQIRVRNYQIFTPVNCCIQGDPTQRRDLDAVSPLVNKYSSERLVQCVNRRHRSRPNHHCGNTKRACDYTNDKIQKKLNMLVVQLVQRDCGQTGICAGSVIGLNKTFDTFSSAPHLVFSLFLSSSSPKLLHSL